jgi:ABC-type sugar transport system ATPase subunit
VNAKSSIPLERITCDFPGVRALEEIDLQFFPGEVHALAGENGAGKSTLLKILAGLVAPTKGKIQIGNRLVASIVYACELGIRSIPQEPALAPDLSIAENLLLGRLPKRGFGRIDWESAFQKGKSLLAKVGLEHLPSERLVAGLGMAEQQLIEIARALAEDGKIYLFDEPTSSLSSREVTKLREIIRTVANDLRNSTC